LADVEREKERQHATDVVSSMSVENVTDITDGEQFTLNLTDPTMSGNATFLANEAGEVVNGLGGNPNKENEPLDAEPFDGEEGTVSHQGTPDRNEAEDFQDESDTAGEGGQMTKEEFKERVEQIRTEAAEELAETEAILMSKPGFDPVGWDYDESVLAPMTNGTDVEEDDELEEVCDDTIIEVLELDRDETDMDGYPNAEASGSFSLNENNDDVNEDSSQRVHEIAGDVVEPIEQKLQKDTEDEANGDGTGEPFPGHAKETEGSEEEVKISDKIEPIIIEESETHDASSRNVESDSSAGDMTTSVGTEETGENEWESDVKFSDPIEPIFIEELNGDSMDDISDGSRDGIGPSVDNSDKPTSSTREDD